MPQILLICCEGKTEQLYFEILRGSIYRIPHYVRINIEGEKGQHKALVDRTVELRKALADEEEVEEEEIECWAVCDDDNMGISFAELSRYAEDNNVNLAFSRPQFESYLLQHFEQSKEVDQKTLYGKLASYAGEDYEKSDLTWLEKLLVDKPKLVDIAITNSDQRRTQSTTPFLTVQELTKRLKSMSRY